MLNIMVFNLISCVLLNSMVKVCKLEILLVVFSLISLVMNFSDFVEFMMFLVEGFDFECFFDFGDGSFDFFGKSCYNLIYFVDGVIIDRIFFMNL